MNPAKELNTKKESLFKQLHKQNSRKEVKPYKRGHVDEEIIFKEMDFKMGSSS